MKITSSVKRVGVSKGPRVQNASKPSAWKEVEESPETIKEVKSLKASRTFHVEETPMSRQYPSPKTHKTFKYHWNLFIDNVAARENFKTGHLSHLEILCDLYVEYEKLNSFIMENGHSFTTVTKLGPQVKPYPEVAALQRVRNDVKNYSKLLGLVLVKDNLFSDKDKMKEDWS